ncbi:gamma-glutamyl-gamma-aminobutyrate hydrolase family protein [Starkeya koreensis]|uniref:Gamma-glutamyl-gamma-aminobutyrate hydrolase family protein n=1 Tax=Ancylobacter koreensis TaxID=266121 RepID=A0ABT0DGX4_9HYPH|nr:gamma-glutamyl-gamma-aminobutyrate hydrolase family protein [Ancylobacter koreensis]MCK0206531.1 gamma-glutamyl-gamma-aminobutyrate hydrolase family protein [Ancylobacter koreensis]
MRPVIGVISDVKASGGHVVHGVTEKYIYAVARGAQAMPVLIPGTISAVDADMAPEQVVMDEIFDLVDGIFLPGSPSNVGPQHYGDVPHDPPLPADPYRDDISLPLIRAALERGVPLFGVCRGFQEMNVAVGGTLFQKLYEQPGRFDHREDSSRDIDTQYGPAHDVELEPGGLLAGLAGADRWRVNSLHGQGVANLAPGLVVEARAEDGTVEAFRVPDAPGFNIAIQWHPEWRFWQDRLSTGVFTAFGAAARLHAEARSRKPKLKAVG